LRDVTKFSKGLHKSENMEHALRDAYGTDRQVRSVWKFPTESFHGAHFATFPRALAERCILLGSKPGDIIFDPYAGTGTTCEVAAQLGRRYIGCELNPRYVAMFKRYRSQQLGLHL
jgi:DNA modification methylase